MKILQEKAAQVYTLYVGMNDRHSYEQRFDTDVLSGMIMNVCRGYRVSFSFHVQKGGYIHESGKYVLENSAVITLIGAPEKAVNEIAADLCAYFNQESVLVEVGQAMYYSVSETVTGE